MRAALLAVDKFYVLPWLNANVASTMGTGAGPTPIVVENSASSMMSLVILMRDCPSGLADARSPSAGGIWKQSS
jgi:hypothetical protein